jgi:hypothetical protein
MSGFVNPTAEGKGFREEGFLRYVRETAIFLARKDGLPERLGIASMRKQSSL